MGSQLTKLIRHPKRRFLTAVRQGNVLVVKVFLDAGMMRSARNGHPVLAVARFGSVDMMRYGGSVDARGKHGRCALHQTVLYAGRDEMRWFLLQQGAIVEMKDDTGYTPLHTAVCGGNVPAVRMLLEYGAEVGMATRYEWYPVRGRGGRTMLDSREDVRKVLVECGVLQESSSMSLFVIRNMHSRSLLSTIRQCYNSAVTLHPISLR